MLILIGVLSMQMAKTSTDSIKEQLFKFPFNAKIITFNIKSDYLDTYLEKKKKSQKPIQLNAQVDNKNNKYDVTAVGIENNEIKKIVEDKILTKIFIFRDYEITKWLKDYEKASVKNDLIKFEDKTQLKEISEIYLKFNKSNLMIIENLATERVITRYEYIKPKWADGKLVLSTVRKESVDGNQITRIVSKIAYDDVDDLGQVPVKLKVSTEQMIYADQGNQVLRKINEEYSFTNFNVEN